MRAHASCTSSLTAKRQAELLAFVKSAAKLWHSIILAVQVTVAEGFALYHAAERAVEATANADVCAARAAHRIAIRPVIK